MQVFISFEKDIGDAVWFRFEKESELTLFLFNLFFNRKELIFN